MLSYTHDSKCDSTCDAHILSGFLYLILSIVDKYTPIKIIITTHVIIIIL